MKFKENYMVNQYQEVSDYLKLLASDFETISYFFGITPIVTRVSDVVQGSSGVHEDKRALDFRDEYLGKFTYSDYQRDKILKLMNDKYHRTDGKLTLISHKFQGGSLHFHLQVPSDIGIVKLWGGIENGINKSGSGVTV